jgi:hypothetical protein
VKATYNLQPAPACLHDCQYLSKGWCIGAKQSVWPLGS